MTDEGSSMLYEEIDDTLFIIHYQYQLSFIPADLVDPAETVIDLIDITDVSVADEGVEIPLPRFLWDAIGNKIPTYKFIENL